MKTDTGKKIVEYIGKNKQVRVIDLVRLLGFSSVAIHKQLRKLIADEKISKIGKPPKVFYVLNAQQNLQQNAMAWAYSLKPVISGDDFYCSTRDVFQARLETLTSNLEQELEQGAYLLGAVAGEIGNGLKFVAKVVKKENCLLAFFSGEAEALLNPNLTIKKVKKKLDGCLSVLNY